MLDVPQALSIATYRPGVLTPMTCTEMDGKGGGVRWGKSVGRGASPWCTSGDAHAGARGRLWPRDTCPPPSAPWEAVLRGRPVPAEGERLASVLSQEGLALPPQPLPPGPQRVLGRARGSGPAGPSRVRGLALSLELCWSLGGQYIPSVRHAPASGADRCGRDTWCDS